MLQRKHRFRGFGSVKPVLKSGVSARQGLFTIRLQKRACQSDAPPCPSRAAIVVSRRTAKSAVLRNRIRRRLYGELHRQWDSLTTPVDLAIIVHDARLADWPTTQLGEVLAQQLKAALAKLP